jgi:hypothetical protein
MNKLIGFGFSLLFSLSLLATEGNPSETLINQFYRQGDTLIRSEILKSLRDYNADELVKNTLINILTGLQYESTLRVQAARSLAQRAHEPDVKNAITRVHDQSVDIYLRKGMLETLYKAVPQDANIRNVLLSNLTQNHDYRIKMASSFALMAAAQNENVQSTLIYVIRNSNQSSQVRIESLKSLFSAKASPKVRSLISEVAMGSHYPSEVRVAAIRMIAALPQSRQFSGQLQEILNYSQHNSLRQAAAKCLRFRLDESDIRWLHLPVNPYTRGERDPFQN